MPAHFPTVLPYLHKVSGTRGLQRMSEPPPLALIATTDEAQSSDVFSELETQIINGPTDTPLNEYLYVDSEDKDSAK